MERLERSHRVVAGLLQAQLSTKVPHREITLYGWKQKGIRFQRTVGRYLKRELPYEIFAGQWLEFEDANGSGFAQPDFYFLTDRALFCLEAKLTQKLQGRLQIDELYRPLLSRIYQKPVVGILVCKNLTRDPGQWKISNPMEVLDETRELTWMWHFLP